MKNLPQTILAIAVVFFALGCSADHAPAPGVMLEISGPDSVQDATSQLRVRVSSGRDGEIEERGDETVDVTDWPAQVFVRASDTKRVWSAEVWALDENDAILGRVSATGIFRAGEVPVARLRLDPVMGQEEDEGGRDGGVHGRDAGNSDREENDGVLIIPAKPDAGTTTPLDSGGSSQPRDAGTTTTAPVDAAMPQPKPDAGPAPSANMCAAAPAYATTTACSKCACSKCGTEVTACHASNEAAKNTQCGAIDACSEISKCTGEGCFCGGSPTCLFPDGACRAPIEAAAGSGSVADVQAARDDANSPVARANALGACRLANCKSECGL